VNPPEDYPELKRRVTEEEYEALLDFAVSLNIEQAFIQDREVADESFIPAFDYTGLF
jgi:putative pyruvate formate lyase activating enzyme